MSRAPGESRIPTVRRSGLPRPASAAPPLLHSPGQYTKGFPPYTPAHQPDAPAHLYDVSPTRPSDRPARLYDHSPTRQPDPQPHLYDASPTHHLAQPPPVVPRLKLSSNKFNRYSEGDLPVPPSRRAPRPASTGSRLQFQLGEPWGDEERRWSRERREFNYRDLRVSTESAFSRQLAQITQGNNDISDPTLTYRVSSIHAPRTCWDPPQVKPGNDPKALSRECVGRRVVVGGAEQGTLRYFGKTAFSSGDWCGIELDRAVGKNNGAVDGVIYFSCRPRYGIFAPAGKVFLDENPLEVLNAKAGPRGLMPSATQSQEPPSVRRRTSDASTATYTIEGRDSSVPNSPESQESIASQEFVATKRTSCRDDHEDEVASLGSPEDATCDESSLGILTPDQMPDFTVTASLGRSPSDEDVAALEDEVCEEGYMGEAAAREVPLIRWDSDQDITAVVDEELFKKDVSAIIRELRTSAEDSSSGGCSPTQPHPSPHPSPETEQFQQDEEEQEALQQEEDDLAVKEQQVKETKVAGSRTAGEDHHEALPSGVDLSRLPAVGRRVAPLTTRLLLASSNPADAPPDVEAAWGAMTTSAGSLDQGYQGDAECDPRSEGGTGTASSPTEDVRLFQGVIDVERLTEGDVSLADDEGEADHGQVTARDRTARIIDGKLYHNHREMRHHDPHTSEMDSSGFYSDLDPRDREAEDESARTDLEPVQEALGHSSLHDSLLDDNHDHTLDDNSLKDDLTFDKETIGPVDEEDRSSASTLRPESKDLTSVEITDRTPSPATTEPPQGSPKSEVGGKGGKAVIGSTKLTDSGICVEENEAQPVAKPRTYDKPWLSRPPPPKKKEEPRKVLAPPPPMPKKNVQSKLKALLEAPEPPSDEQRRARQPRKNRWDDVMNKIASGQKEPRPKVEVKSRLMETLKQPVQMSPQAEKIRQERRERRERRERQAAAAAVAARRARSERKRSSASIRSNRTSRAPSLDSLPTDPMQTLSRGSSPDRSQASHKSSSTVSGGGSRGSRESRAHHVASRASAATVDKKRQEPPPPPRRPRLDNIKSTIPKPGRLPPRKITDPVKAARPGVPTSGPRGPHGGGHGGHGGGGPGQQHPVPHAEQLRRLEAEVAARVSEVKTARDERDQAGRGLQALSVIIHHLTHTYDPFSTPRLKAEVVRLTSQLMEARLNLDESTAAVRRLQEEAEHSVSEHKEVVQQLEQKNHQTIEQLNKQHQQDLDLVLEKQRKNMAKFTEEQQVQREELSRAHSVELEQMEGEWRTKLDLQHEKHLCALQELNTRHTQKLRELETSRRARENELEVANERLLQEQEGLKLQSKKLEDTLMNDTDHRLQAMRRMCNSLKSEVDSLKTVVEMRNAEIHELRGQVVEMDRLTNDLELARDKSKALQAKTEDLQAQMEQRSLSERHLVNEHRMLIETYQKEANFNKRLSLENEELTWKLRQREEIMSTSMPSSTLGFRCLFGGSKSDLVSRSAAPARRQEGASSPQAAPRSPRVVGRSPSGKISPSKTEPSKRRSRLGLSPEDGLNGDGRVQEVSLESPPPSPCVKAVVEKSNSVSFILDLNDSQSDDSFLDLPPSPRPRPHRTVSLSAADRPRTPTQARRVNHNNRTNSLNRNVTPVEGKSKSMNGKPKDFLGKNRGVNGRGRDLNGSHDSNSLRSQTESGRSASESSEGGSEVERVSPTGLAWTVPVHKPKSPTKTNAPRQNGSPVRGRIEHHLLEDPDEDEYEETPTHQFIEVVELSRVGLTSSSEAASDSELSQCDLIKGGSSTDSDSDSSEGELHNKKNNGHQTLSHKNSPWCPQEGAGEAMITDELLKQYSGDPLTVEPLSQGKRAMRRHISPAPSSDSEDNMIVHNNGSAVDVSWSEDVDITSSSEMHEL